MRRGNLIDLKHGTILPVHIRYLNSQQQQQQGGKETVIQEREGKGVEGIEAREERQSD